MNEVKLAKLFHQVYEDLAPSFGYETRIETKEFDENSKNGKLMIATCKAILPEIKASQLDAIVSPHTKKFEEWLDRYFTMIDTRDECCYRDRHNKIYTLKELHKKFERAMLQSPFVSG